MAGWSARSHEPEFLNLRLFSQSRSVWKFREHFFAFSGLSWKIPAGSIPDASETQPDSALLGSAKSLIPVTMSVARARLIIEKTLTSWGWPGTDQHEFWTQSIKILLFAMHFSKMNLELRRIARQIKFYQSYSVQKQHEWRALGGKGARIISEAISR